MGGPRAYAVSMEHVEQDILRHCGFLKSSYPGVPMFIYGHSMGGMLAVSLVIRNPAFFKGMVLEGPLILPDPAQVTPVRLLLGKVACSLIPEMQLEKIRVEQVTSDKETQEKLSRDKLRWMGGTKLGVAVAFVRCLEAIHTQMSSVTLPFLVLHGGNDSLCMLAGSHLLINQSSSENKRLKVFPTANHHLILEERKVREAAVGETVSWILDQLDGGALSPLPVPAQPLAPLLPLRAWHGSPPAPCSSNSTSLTRGGWWNSVFLCVCCYMSYSRWPELQQFVTQFVNL